MGIFRAYDIRGVYGKDLTQEIMARIGEAAGTYCPGTFTVGRDFRAHGAQLQGAFVSGLKKIGSNANLIGTCPASLCVFANWKMENDVTAYVTASHLPAEWNGIKFFHQDGVGFFEEENKKLGEISTSGNFKRGKGLSKKLKAMDEEYADFMAKKIKPATPLLLAVIVTQLVATLITVYGILLPPMGWTLALLVLGICSATVCDNRFCKSATLQIT